MGSPDSLFARLLVIFLAIGLHEYAHCKVADMAGDPTPSIYGRLTLNLFKHFDPLGTVMIIITSITGFGIGWGKPAPMDPRKMANPRWDFFAAVAAGPVSNVLQAIIWAVLLRMQAHQGGINPSDFFSLLCIYGVLINLSLCFFNLIPLGPLDGHWLIGQLLPDKLRWGYYRWNAGVGTILMFVMVLGSQLFAEKLGFDPLGFFIYRPTMALFRILTGLNLGL